MDTQNPDHCGCEACEDGTTHLSHCAVHNEPAYPNGPCDCGSAQTVTYPPEMLPPPEEGEVQIVVVNGPEHDRIRHYAKSAINGFDTLDAETAIENAKFDLASILRLIGETTPGSMNSEADPGDK